MGSGSLLAQLKRRNVLRAGVLYAGAVWAFGQGLSQFSPALGLPDWATRWFLIAAAIGFPFWIAFSWFYEFTPQGLKRESAIAADASIARSAGKKLDRWIIAVLAVAVVLLLTNTVFWRKGAGLGEGPTAGLPAKSIAVLPFENLSGEKDNAYFASGMQDMILTKLADIADLKVISRTSTEKYASHPDNLKIIAQQLGVASVLEGSVQKAGNQVLINVQLIDALSDNHLWADAYPRALDNIFGVEGEVAQKVADALQAKLSPAEIASVAKIPTRNAAAYDLFLKAEYQLNQARDSWDGSTFLAADADYRRAIVLDPEFALAYARLAYCQLSRHWFARPLTAAELADVKAAMDRALALAPDLADAHLALAYYDYWVARRYDDAIVEFQHALQWQPGNAKAIAGLGFVSRRNGHWSQAQTYLQKSVLVSPRDAQLNGEYGATLTNLRRYAEADQQLRVALELDPTNADTRDQLLTLRLFGFGDVAGARQAYQPPPDWRLSGVTITSGEALNVVNPRVYPDMFDRKFDAALREWDSAPIGTPEERIAGQVGRAAIKIIAGRRAEAAPRCEDLAAQLQTALAQQPDSLKLLQQSSWINVCLGRNAEAMANARRAVALLPITSDSYSGADQLAGLAQIDAQTGASDEALQLIGQLLAMPAGAVMSFERLKLDPVWDPLREDPRFQTLLERAGAVGASGGSLQ